MKNKQTANQQFMEWIHYLEGGNQKEFARKTGMSEASISRIKGEITVVSKATVKRLREIYDISPQEYDLGPDEYEKRRREKESASVQTVKALLDPERASFVYALSQIQESLSRTPSLGVSFCRQFESKPKDFFYVYVDKEGEIEPFGQLVCVNSTEEPKMGDTVLVWDGDRAKFVNWKQRSKAKEFDRVYGIVIG